MSTYSCSARNRSFQRRTWCYQCSRYPVLLSISYTTYTCKPLTPHCPQTATEKTGVLRASVAATDSRKDLMGGEQLSSIILQRVIYTDHNLCNDGDRIVDRAVARVYADKLPYS